MSKNQQRCPCGEYGTPYTHRNCPLTRNNGDKLHRSAPAPTPPNQTSQFSPNAASAPGSATNSFYRRLTDPNFSHTAPSKGYTSLSDSPSGNNARLPQFTHQHNPTLVTANVHTYWASKD